MGPHDSLAHYHISNGGVIQVSGYAVYTWDDDGPHLAWDDEEYDHLTALFPAMYEVSTSCPAPNGVTCKGYNDVLGEMLAHLNDTHKWPRTEADRNEGNKHLPTIYDWVKEQADEHGWDLTSEEVS